MGHQRRVLVVAVLSRLAVLVLSAVFHAAFDSYDTSSTVPQPTRTQQLFGGLAHWDGVFMLEIATNGYAYEQFLAFFPLYPLMLRVVSATVVSPVVGAAAVSPSSILVAALLVSNVAFVLAAVVLYNLTYSVTGHKALAEAAALWFCINPASVFFSAAYTESLFALLSFAGMLACYRRFSWVGAVLFSLAAATRSNGLVLAGYLVYYGAASSWTVWHSASPGRGLRLLMVVVTTVAQAGLVAVPFWTFQQHGRRLFCSRPQVESGVAGQQPAWCLTPSMLPYTHVQRHYWNVGFLSYYTPAQVPNLLLGAPALLLAGCFVVGVVRGQWAQLSTLCLGDSRVGRGAWGPSTFVFAVHLAFLALTAATIMHVQVATRFLLSASPCLYWLLAHAVVGDSTADKRSCKGVGSKIGVDRVVASLPTSLIVGYCVTYAVVGTVLFSVFLPWT
eukprot:m.304491 g.304491  ORF g.304491 m.304491 type:complete len:446 (+) comp19604_c1_seq3:1647-2984(+)